MDSEKKSMPADLTPRTKKVAAKKTVQTVASHVAAKEVGETVTKVVVQAGAKAGAKTFAKGLSNPWLLVADGVDLGVRKACESCGIDEDDARVVGKASGLSASIAIGATVGGPVGAAAGFVLWGIGEGIAKLFDLD